MMKIRSGIGPPSSRSILPPPAMTRPPNERLSPERAAHEFGRRRGPFCGYRRRHRWVSYPPWCGQCSEGQHSLSQTATPPEPGLQLYIIEAIASPRSVGVIQHPVLWRQGRLACREARRLFFNQRIIFPDTIKTSTYMEPVGSLDRKASDHPNRR